jgi:hypothetical protein
VEKLRSIKEEGTKTWHQVGVQEKDEQDGSIRYKGRIVSLGYMQIQVDYTQSFSPVEMIHLCALLSDFRCSMTNGRWGSILKLHFGR